MNEQTSNSTAPKATPPTPTVRTGQAEGHLPRQEFETRFRARFADPAFANAADAIDELLDIAWDGYQNSRKSPVTRKAGKEFADPDYDLSVDWIKTREEIDAAQQRHDADGRSRMLLINGAARNDGSCPGEISKTLRLAKLARSELEAAHRHGPARPERAHLRIRQSHLPVQRLRVDRDAAVPLALQLLSEPLAGPEQRLDERDLRQWVAAHAVIILTPVYWYQAPAVLKLMIDRLVCADGGNPDPTSTHGKKAEEAKALEQDWDYPKHLAGRAFGLVVHGDVAGIEGVRRSLSDWLDWMLIHAGAAPARSLHRLLRAVRHQPRRLRRRHSPARRGAQCRAGPNHSGHAAPRGSRRT